MNSDLVHDVCLVWFRVSICRPQCHISDHPGHSTTEVNDHQMRASMFAPTNKIFNNPFTKEATCIKFRI